MPLALYALALGGFGIGLTEFVIMGLLPEVAADFAVSETAAGYFISVYALNVAIGAILLTIALIRINQKQALLILMALFIIGNLISALAGNYATMMSGRIIASLCHGAFFGLGSVVATKLVPPNKRAAAIATMFTGLTLSNVLGVPLGTMLGQAAGWRATFWAITLIGIIAFIAIATLIPKQTVNPNKTNNSLRKEFAVFGNPQIWLSLSVTILGYGGMFGGFTYIAYTLTEVSQFSTSTVPWLLILFGLGLFIGNTLGGKAADKNLATTLITTLTILTFVLAFFALTATNQILTIFSLTMMGIFGFATVPALQMRIMNFAQSAPTIASAANIAAFNLGNALGAWLGGTTIALGLGYTSPLWAGTAMTILGLLVLLFATKTKNGEFFHSNINQRL